MEKLVDKVAEIVAELSGKNDILIVAIDGRCASGKTTLSTQLQKLLECNVIHMDEFFLRPCQRTVQRLEMVGENVDHERFLEEVLLPLREGKEFSYRPYDCKLGKLREAISVSKNKINIIEGSYSCHKDLREYYDLRIFMTIDESEQIERIIKRNGENAAKVFREKWIPMEEKYFESMNIGEIFHYSLENFNS